MCTELAKKISLSPSLQSFSFEMARFLVGLELRTFEPRFHVTIAAPMKVNFDIVVK